MKNIVSILFLIVFTPIFSQEYMDEIVRKTCECVNKIPDSEDKNKQAMQIGVCMLEASMPYKDKIKKDLKIDLGNVSRDAERFGEIIGVKMATVCPDALMKMADFDDSEEDVTSRDLTGKIVAIDDNKIVEFSVKDSSNRLTKFYWLTFIESNIELTTQYKNLKDKDVNIVYITQEFFDSRIGEYRFFNVILNLEVLDK
jgi:hypothetical protein